MSGFDDSTFLKCLPLFVIHTNDTAQVNKVEASAGELLVPDGLYSPVAKCSGTYFEIRIWIELSRKAFAGGLLVPEGLYSPVAKYSSTCFKYENELNCQENSKFCKFISKRRIISLRHSSIWLNFKALCLICIRRLFQFSYYFGGDFQLFRP